MTTPTKGTWELCTHSTEPDCVDIKIEGGGWFIRLSAGYPFSAFENPLEIEAELIANAELIVKAVNTLNKGDL